MKHIILFFFITSQITRSFGGNILKSSVKEVCVYTSGVRITSEGEVNLQKGTQEILIGGISAFADESSLIFKCNQDFSLLSIQLRKKTAEESAAGPEMRRMEDSLILLKGKLSRVQNQIIALQEELAMIRANQKLSPAGGVQTAELEKAASFFRTRVEDVLNRQYEAEQMKNQFQERLKNLQQKTQEMAAEQAGGNMLAVVTLRTGQSGKANFQLAYTCGNAGWTPLYDIQATSDKEMVSFLAKASVWQNTGLSWTDVKVSLSTGSPGSQQEIPEFNPWYLSIRPVLPKRTYNTSTISKASAPSMAAASYDQSQALSSPQKSFEQSSAPDAANTEGATQNIYELNGSFNLRSDGKPVSMDIRKFELPARFQYMSRPRQEKSAFLEARLRDWGKSGLLPGEASIYLDGNFVGKTNFETGPAGDTLSLSFGKDQNISVERKQYKYQHDKNLTGSEKSLEIGYELQVKNRKSATSELVIEDQLPLSPNAESEVELLESSGASYDKESGKLRWATRLKGGDSSTYRFRFKVKYPKSMVLDSSF